MHISPNAQQSAGIAAVLAVTAVALRTRSSRGRLHVLGLAATEASIIAALYGLWQVVGRLSIMNADRAVERAVTIVRWQHDLHLPSEAALQRLILPHPWLVQAANAYYALVHGPALLAFLVWLFTRHRPAYRAQRNTIAVVTGVCLAVQFVPVAPPRMLSGFIDTGHLYHQSVYGAVGQGMSDQFSAMPSVHVAWALLIGLGVVAVGTSRWRWLVLLHPIVTVFVIVVTANHFWLDGIVAAAIIPLAWGIKAVARRLLDLARSLIPERDDGDLVIDLDGLAGRSAELGEQVVG